jgi:hypothetical protein
MLLAVANDAATALVDASVGTLLATRPNRILLRRL